jgi:hypothetical protein
MKRSTAVIVAVLVLILAGRAPAQEPGVAVARGQVQKVDKDKLTVQSRMPDGKFGPVLVLRLTGTSRLTLATPRKMADGVAAAQKDIQAVDLRPGQEVAVIYLDLGDGMGIVLSLVTLGPK